MCPFSRRKHTQTELKSGCILHQGDVCGSLWNKDSLTSLSVVDLKHLPLIHSYGSIQTLSHNIDKSDRQHDLVIAVSIFLTLFSFNLTVSIF